MTSHYDPALTPAYSYDCYRYSSTQYVRIATVDGSCPSGTTRTQKTHQSQLCGTSYTYYDCLSTCTGCSNCTDNASWTSAGTGYEKRTKKECNLSTCKCESSTIYQCAKGYYGSSTNGTSGCTICPMEETFSANGTTESAGTRFNSGCYIPAGTLFSDTTGSGEYPERCDYDGTAGLLACSLGDDDFCLSNDDCANLLTCNTTTNCCELRAVDGGDLVLP